jgi:WD40 repeat protein/formylglycine-generating enzyme required for sulfatase activity
MSNTATNSCPNLAQFQRLMLGQLPEADREKLLTHLEGCDACARLCKALPERDTLIERLRSAATIDDPASNSTIVRLVARLSQLRPASEPAARSDMIFPCQACTKKMKAPANLAGKKVQCPHCKVAVPVPATAPRAVTAPAISISSAETQAPARPSASVVPPPGAATIDQAPARAAKEQRFDFLAPPQAPDELGRLGPYRVLNVLGSGGMGVVFRAEDPQLARMVALKALLPGLLTSEGARERFLREARAAARIKHDHIVSIYQVGEDRGALYLAMELLEGESLEARLAREGKLPVSEVLHLGRQIALALAAAHKTGLIHRDIKPGNIWLESLSEPRTSVSGSPLPDGRSPDSRVKILDFGLARATSESAQLTQQGAIIGTPAYMAPEQGQGKKLDARCDLFSLGCVLYRMATGEKPFRGNDVISTLMAVATETPRPPQMLEPGLPRALSDLIVNLLAKEAADRPASAQIIVDKLDQIAQEFARPAPARPRKRGPALAAAAGFLALLAAGIVFFMQTPDGMVRIEIDDPAIKLAIEGHAATITNADRQPITLTPGKHGLTIRRGDFTFNTAGFEVRKGTKTVLKVTWHPGQKMVVTQDGSVIGEKVMPQVVAQPLAPRYKNALGMEFALVPRGKSWLGGGGGKPGDREVEFKDDFYLGIYPVTQEEWHKVTGLAPSRFSRTGERKDAVKDCPDADLKRFPVESVSWDDCRAFMDRLNDLTGESGWIYRLPTTAEWEYACRGGPLADRLQSAYHFYLGKPLNELPADQANFNDVLKRPSPVGSYRPNRLGLFDMHGNVWQWCNDTEGFEKDPNRLAMGGSWAREACVAARKDSAPRTLRQDQVGLRVARVRVTTDPDRRAVEWVLASGGSAGIVVQGQRREIKAGGRTPADPFVVESIHLLNTTVTPADLHRLHELAKLREVGFQNVPIGDADLAELADLSNLEWLLLWHTGVRNQGLGHLKGLTKLKVLGLFGNPGITDAGLVHLKSLTKLENLDLNGTRITDQGLAYLSSLTNLESLNIMGTPVHGGGLAQLKGLPRLRALLAAGSQVDDRVVINLQGFPALEVLGLDGTRVTDDGLKLVPGLPKLKRISLEHTKIGDSGLDHLARAKSLNDILLDDTAVSAEGIARLKKALPNAAVSAKNIAQLPADPNRRLATPDITPEPLALKPGEPVSGLALVQKPAALPGLRSWTIETLANRSYCGLLFRPDGKQFATTCRDGTLRIYDVGSDIPRQILVGHNHVYFDATWSPDGKYLASAGGDKTLRIWDSQSGRLLRTIAGAGPLGSVAWSPGGNSVACISGATQEVCLWSAADGNGLKSLPMPQGNPTSLAWSRDGKRLAGSFPGKVTFWDTASGEAVQTLLGDSPEQPFARIRLSPDGQRLAASSGRDVYVWDLATSKKLAKLEHPGGSFLAAFAWSPGGRQILSWEWGGKRRFWDASTGKILREISGEFYYGTIASDGKTALGGGAGRNVAVQDFETSKLIGKVLPEAYAARHASWSPTGDRIAVGIGDVPIFDSASGKLLRRLATARFGPWGTAWSPTGKLLATGLGAQPVQFWNPDLGDNRATLDGQTDAFAWSRDGRWFATGGNDKTVRIWNADGKQLQTLKAHTAGISSLAWSGDATLAAGSRDGSIRLWDGATRKAKRVLQEHGAAVTSLAWSPDGKWLVSMGAEGSLYWWDPRDGTVRHKAIFPNTGGLAWSPDGKTVAAGGREVIRFFDGASGKLLQDWNVNYQGFPFLTYSPKGNSLLTTCGHGVQVVDVPTGHRRGVLLGLPEGHCLALSSDGHWRGTPGVEKQLIYIAVTDTGQELLGYQEFSKKYGWKNDPNKVCLLGAPHTDEPPR